jgi:uncharacterized membrane protein
MKERALIYLVVVLVVINVAALGTIIYQRLADPDWGALRPKAMMEADPAILKRLRLAPEQREMMRESRHRVDSLVTPVQTEIHRKQQELYSEMDSDRPDTALINNLIGEIGALQVTIQKTMVHNFLDDSRNITPDQRRAFLKLIEMRARSRERPLFEPGKGFGRGHE